MSYYMVDNPNPNTAQGVYPRRGGHRASGTCIVHTSEGNWRNGVNALTALIQTRSDYGAYHEGCDWLDIVSYYPPDWETWGDSETNNWSYHISAACKTSDWGNMPADVEEGYYRNLGKMAAKFVNHMASQGVIVPLRRISGYEARNKVPGFCAHGDSGISRSDPGANFDWNRFFRYTKDAIDGTVTGEDEMAAMEFADKVFLQTVNNQNADRVINYLVGVQNSQFEALVKLIQSTLDVDENALAEALLAKGDLVVTKKPE